MATGRADTKELILKVEAATELAKRNLNELARAVQADSAKMETSLGRIDTAMGKVQGAFGSLNGLLGGLAAGVGVGAIAALGRNVLQFADDLATAADQAGISVERYQTLNEAFRTLELSTDQVDKVLKTLQATLGDVQNGADNTATKALDRLGISADIMSGKVATGDELLDALAATATKAGTQAQFTADIVDIFGKRVGVDLAAALKDGGTALHELEEAMRQSGNVIDQHLIDKLADANEAIDKFSKDAKSELTIFAGELFTIFDSLGTAFDVVTGGWDDALTGFTSRGLYNVRNFARDVENLIAQMLGSVDSVVNRVRSAANEVNRYIDFKTPDWLVKPEANTPMLTLERDFRRARTMADIFEGGVFKNVPGARRAIEPRPASGAGAGRRGGARRPTSGGGARRRGSGGGRSAGASRAKAVDFWDDSNFKTSISTMSAFDTEASLSQMLTAPLDDMRAITLSASELQGILAGIGADMPDMGTLLADEDRERILGFAADLRGDLAAGLAQAIVYGDNLGDVLENTFKRAAAALIESGLLNLLTGGKQGTSFGSIFSNIGSLFGGKFAAGGNPPVGKISLVGEKGPELFVPKVPGTIIPNHALGRSGGGGEFRIHVEPSPMFNVHVEQVSAKTAGMVVGASVPTLNQAAYGYTVNKLSKRRLP